MLIGAYNYFPVPFFPTFWLNINYHMNPKDMVQGPIWTLPGYCEFVVCWHLIILSAIIYLWENFDLSNDEGKALQQSSSSAYYFFISWIFFHRPTLLIAHWQVCNPNWDLPQIPGSHRTSSDRWPSIHLLKLSCCFHCLHWVHCRPTSWSYLHRSGWVSLPDWIHIAW